MNTVLRMTLLCAIILYYISIFYLLRRKSLALKYTLTWLGSGLIMLITVIFPDGVRWIVNKLGIIEVTNGIFAICIFCILLILISMTSVVSKMDKKNKEIAQQCSLLEKRLRNLERRNSK